MNLRGTDLPLAPVFNAYVILTRSAQQLEVFIDSIKISDDIKQSLASQLNGTVSWRSYEEIYDRVEYYVRDLDLFQFEDVKILQKKFTSQTI